MNKCKPEEQEQNWKNKINKVSRNEIYIKENKELQPHMIEAFFKVESQKKIPNKFRLQDGEFRKTLQLQFQAQNFNNASSNDLQIFFFPLYITRNDFSII